MTVKGLATEFYQRRDSQLNEQYVTGDTLQDEGLKWQKSPTVSFIRKGHRVWNSRRASSWSDYTNYPESGKGGPGKLKLILLMKRNKTEEPETIRRSTKFKEDTGKGSNYHKTDFWSSLIWEFRSFYVFCWCWLLPWKRIIILTWQSLNKKWNKGLQIHLPFPFTFALTFISISFKL